MAVNRRQKENDTFSDIALTLPIEENAKELDKASILRIAIHYLRLRDILADCEDPDELSPSEFDIDNDAAATAAAATTSTTSSFPTSNSSLPNYSKDVLQALDGFMLLVSKDGKVLFASESISQYLGLRQVDVIGIELQDIIHPQDFMDVAAIFQSQGHDVSPDVEALGNNHLRRNFVVRMRCAFTPSVRSVTRCSNFKPIYCSAFLKFSNKKVKDGEFLGMAVFCKVASVMKVKELCVGAYFKTKHSLDLSYTAIDTRIRWILGFDPAKMVGAKAYDYFHPEDLLATSSCHVNLLTQGHSHSPCYRFMAQSGDWIWVRSKSCVTYDSVTHRPNGLSIYTWIVRYDEEDERMIAINQGEDGSNLGIKDVSNTSSAVSLGGMDINELCSTSSKPDTALPTTDATSPQSYTSTSPQSHTSASPQSHTSSSPSLSSVSPEHSVSAPPNVNPFQSSSTSSWCSGGSPYSSPSSSVQSSYYDISSPKHVPTYIPAEPYKDVCTPTLPGKPQNEPVTSTANPPKHYKLSDIRQSSSDSLKETSPPYSSSGANVYTYSTSSPEASLGMGCGYGSGTEPGSVRSTVQYQTFSDFQSPSMMQQSPISGGHSPAGSYGANPSPYSNDGMGMSLMSSSPPQSHSAAAFSIEATLFSPQNGGYLDLSPQQQQQPGGNTDMIFTTQHIKQEPVQYLDGAQFYANTPQMPHPQSIPSQKHHQYMNSSSYVSQAKARYATVNVGGAIGAKQRYQHEAGHRQPSPEDATIRSISQWLQQGTTPPHVY